MVRRCEIFNDNDDDVVIDDLDVEVENENPECLLHHRDSGTLRYASLICFHLIAFITFAACCLPLG